MRIIFSDKFLSVLKVDSILGEKLFFAVYDVFNSLKKESNYPFFKVTNVSIEDGNMETEIGFGSSGSFGEKHFLSTMDMSEETLKTPYARLISSKSVTLSLENKDKEDPEKPLHLFVSAGPISLVERCRNFEVNFRIHMNSSDYETPILPEYLDRIINDINLRLAGELLKKHNK
ncbi:MAG: hypothetical protein NDI62_00410 [Burkholderiales bacterium]|nr:hypothetical protein [Burkholderiales bacterium]